MGNMQGLMSKHVRYFYTPSIEPPKDKLAALIAATQEALDELGSVVSDTCFKAPDALTPERIMAYALSLIRLRDCAAAAGLERLMKACDAIAVSVAKLIEDCGNACPEVCESLTHFVVHAEDMIRLHPQYAAEQHATDLS